MLITKEQQEAWVSNYVKENHTADECIGFVDGINKALDAVKNISINTPVIKSLPTDSEVRKAGDEHSQKFKTQASSEGLENISSDFVIGANWMRDKLVGNVL